MEMTVSAENSAAAVSAALNAKFVPPDVIKGKVALIDERCIAIVEGNSRDQYVRSHISLIERTLGTVLDVKELTADEFARIGGRRVNGGNGSTGPARAQTDGDFSTMQREVMRILEKAHKLRASDVHFVNRASETKVRFRIDGVLRDVETLDTQHGRSLCGTIYRSMLDQGKSDYNERLTQDGRVSAEYTRPLGLSALRVATRPLEDYNLFVLRLQQAGKAESLTLPGLGYTKQHIADMHTMMIRDGINMLSGSTGSGKTTTLAVVAGMLLKMHGGDINLATVEDPIEILLKFPWGEAVQSPLGPEETWADAIRNEMRLDPDFLLVGEIRELEAALAAIQGAMTGHGLWTTTHAKHAWASLDRLHDLDVPIARLSDASLFTGLMNQALGPVLCTHEGCAKPYVGFKRLVREDVQERVEKLCDVEKVRIANQPNTDCPVCGGLGYRNRTVLAEVVPPTQRLMNIFKSDGSAEARSAWIKEGGRTAIMHLIDKINAGIMDPMLGEAALKRPLDEDQMTMA
jgi:general secretion pathway protein E